MWGRRSRQELIRSTIGADGDAFSRELRQEFAGDAR
jgi:hypothetical protein